MKILVLSFFTFLKVILLSFILKISISLVKFDSYIKFSSSYSVFFSKNKKMNLNKTLKIINFCSRVFPFWNCFISSSVLKKIYPNCSELEFYIGVTRSEHGEFYSHAWVEKNGNILLGEIKNINSFKKILKY